MFGSDEGDFIGNVQFQNSCAFSLIQIGEKAKRISDELARKYPSVEWSDISKFRDVLSHNYDRVNLQIVWNAVMNEVSVLKNECKTILADLKRFGL